MEFLKDKKIIIGGLAIVGTIALIAYLKPKAKLNSEGFYGADGMNLSNFPTNPFESPISPKPIGGSATPIPVPIDVCNLPNTFTRKVFTDRGAKSYCGRYDRTLGKKGFIYRLQPELGVVNINTGAVTNFPFISGNFYNPNGSVIGTNPTIISYSDFETAWINGQSCNK
jgi:hypothetical protein